MAEEAESEAPKKKSKLPLIIIMAVLLLAGGGGGAWFFLMKPPAEEHAEGADEPKKVAHKKKAKAPGTPPTFVILDQFTFNLLDDDQDRFAQIGVTLEVEDTEVENEIKAMSPAIRNALLLIMTSKTSKQLLSISGKQRLSHELVKATNAILAGEPAPRIVLPRKKIRRKPRSSSRTEKPAKSRDGHGQQARRDDRDDHYRDDRSRRNRYDDDGYRRRDDDDFRYGRRAPDIPHRVAAAHFSRFLVQ